MKVGPLRGAQRYTASPFLHLLQDKSDWEGCILSVTPAVESDGRREVCLRPELQRGMETYLVRVPSDSKINHGNGDATIIMDF